MVGDSLIYFNHFVQCHIQYVTIKAKMKGKQIALVE